MAPLGGLGVGSRRPNGAAPVRKLTIKPLRAPPRPPEGFEEDAWRSLEVAIDAIHDATKRDGERNGGSPVPSYETLYRSVEDVCVHKKAPWLFEKLRAKLEGRVDKRVRALKASAAAMDPEAFLCAFDTAWQEHCDAVDKTRRVFLYLDRARVGAHQHHHPSFDDRRRQGDVAERAAPRAIWDVGVALFREALVSEKTRFDDDTHTNDRSTLSEHRARALAAAEARNLSAENLPVGEPTLSSANANAARVGTVEKRSRVDGASNLDATRLASRGVSRLIERERDGGSRDARGLTRRATRAFVALGFYRETFEPMFLESTAARYAREGDELRATLDPFEYARHCETRLREEAAMCDDALDAATTRRAVAVVARCLVEKHLQGLLDDAFTKAFGENKTDEMARFYTLARRCGGGGGQSERPGKSLDDATGRTAADGCSKFVDAVRRAFGSSLRELGMDIVKDETREKDMVPRLLALKTAADDAVKRAFDGGEAFAATAREAFEHFVNARANKPPELIAKFVDGVLRAQGGGGAETERALDGALGLFRHVQGKDAFEAFYKKDLAKRLLLGKSASVDAEKSMISRLKAECGAQFTAKLEGMFKDVDLSRDLMKAHNESRKKSTATAISTETVTVTETETNDVESYVNVLTAGSWPTYPRAEINLPRELERARDAFAAFYLGKHSGRKLAWLDGLGHCVLRARFDKGEKELCTSTFQAAVLLLFNSARDESMTAREILDASGMEDGECRRTLQSLACGKHRVLTKTPKGRDVADTDVFTVNAAFTERLFRVKINSIQLRETEADAAETNEKVFQDRQYQIDACLVRVMKTRKSLAHQSLVSETFAQIAFPAKPADVKKRIESLIEREYLERDRNDPQTYNYLA
jgi:cullin-4